MYWPTGTPKAYSLSKYGAQTTQSDDGVEEKHDSESAEKGSNSAVSNVPRSSNQSLASGGDIPDLNGVDETDRGGENEVLTIVPSRHGQSFASLTRSTLTVWNAKPTVALSSIVRSKQSLKAYGKNCALVLRPDGRMAVVQTAFGYLITYSVDADSQTQVYRTLLPENHRHARRGSTAEGHFYRRPSVDVGPGEGDGIKDITLRFRMVIRIDAGISNVLALDDELVVATLKPAALQSIRWVGEDGNSQTSTELLGRMSWYQSKGPVVEMVHDRPMNLTCWLGSDGKAYAVQRRSARHPESGGNRHVYQGLCFRGEDDAVKSAIDARFSLIAVGCTDGRIEAYIVKDYSGSIPLSHTYRLPSVTPTVTGKLTQLAYTPDGYCLFAGYEKGWAMWSVYGKLLSHTFGSDRAASSINNESYLQSIRSGFWLGGGCELALLAAGDDKIWMMDVVRSAASACLTLPNTASGLLFTENSISLYRGHDVQDLTALGSDTPMWQTVRVPNSYLVNNWPIRVAAASPDQKYVAVAGRAGLAHYSVASGRWKRFEDLAREQAISVRGGLAWYLHFLIAGLVVNGRYCLRVYSREKALEKTICEEELSAPAIVVTMSGTDSLLVYTHDNVLSHYVVAPTGASVRLVQVGQIGFHGIIRAPPRVRAISWILPEQQLENGDPSRDVETASVVFLVDGKLVLLQPGMSEGGEARYDMRVVAQNVETFLLMRDNLAVQNDLASGLKDSLWYFDGDCHRVWPEVHDLLSHAPAELGRELPAAVRVPTDFYPLAPLTGKGVVHGLDTELIQRRDTTFSYLRSAPRTSLFLPQLLRHHLAEYNSPAALHLAESYKRLPYFAHALEILLHDVLDAEVDHPPDPPETALLPTVVSFLSSFDVYLDVIVNCTRKTELRSWRTLFAYLPLATQLFEEALSRGKLPAAAGYLLVLHAMAEPDTPSGQHGHVEVGMFARLLKRATQEGEWDLCGELARFLVGIDGGGQTLRAVLAESGLEGTPKGMVNGSGRNGGHTSSSLDERTLGSDESVRERDDYFSMQEND